MPLLFERHVPGFTLVTGPADRFNRHTMPVTSATEIPPPRAGLRTALWHDRLDRASGALLIAAVLFAPWAFGGTPAWAITALNAAGYAAGALLLVKLGLRWFLGHQPPRWESRHPSQGIAGRLARVWAPTLGVLTLLILIYCALSALNARADYDPELGTFQYRRAFVPWLPHSYDASRSWQTFARVLALACWFWAARDWLLGKTMADRRELHRWDPNGNAGLLVPRRLQLLLWILSLNGAILAAEALLQRASGTEKLLWLVRPRLNAVPEAQLGPFNYRSNGAQYLNLVWPVTLGLWWRLHHLRRFQRRTAGNSGRVRYSRAHHVLLPAAGLMAATSVFSLSRGGAAVAVGAMIAVLVIFWVGWRSRRARVRLAMLGFGGLSVGLGLWLGGQALFQRFETLDEGWVQRETMYDTARRMARDFPWFGTGPGTLGPVFQIYRKSTEEYWPAQLHNDWLEYRVTWGRVGMGLLLLAFGWVCVRYFLPGGVITSWRLPLLYAVALGGCLLHARWDFPLQIYSIQQLVLLHCAALSLFSHPRWGAA